MIQVKFIGSSLNNKLPFCIVLLVTTVLSIITSCGGNAVAPANQKPESGDTPVPSSVTSAGPLKGVSLSPKSFQSADFNTFLVESRKAGEIISWAGDWAELMKPGSSPFVVTELSDASSQSSFIPVIELQVFSQSTGKLLRPLDTVNKEEYVSSAANFATKYKPQYLGIGIEVNILNEKSSADFNEFVLLFEKTCDAVKIASPATRVFTVFQLEKMKGLNGGLFGGSNDPSQNEWSLLERFPKADLFAFTTYPGLVYKAPSEMPADYYTEIRLHTRKPIAFTEISWQSASVSADWQGSETEQADFIRSFFVITTSLKPEFNIWSFLYDQTTIVPFNSMGLFQTDGTPKPGWDAWLEN